jgi:hypothetical protein
MNVSLVPCFNYNSIGHTRHVRPLLHLPHQMARCPHVSPERQRESARARYDELLIRIDEPLRWSQRFSLMVCPPPRNRLPPNVPIRVNVCGMAGTDPPSALA